MLFYLRWTQKLREACAPPVCCRMLIVISRTLSLWFSGELILMFLPELCSVHAADHANHSPLNLDVVGTGINGGHSSVSGLQAHAAILVVKPLEGGLLFGLQPYRHGLTVLGRLLGFHDDQVAIIDEGVYHRGSLDAQSVQPVHMGSMTSQEVARYLDRFLGGHAHTDIFQHGYRRTGSDGRRRDGYHIDRLAVAIAPGGVHHLYSARLVAVTTDIAGFLQGFQVVVHDRGRGIARLGAHQPRHFDRAFDLTDRGRIPVVSDKLTDIFENKALALG